MNTNPKLALRRQSIRTLTADELRIANGGQGGNGGGNGTGTGTGKTTKHTTVPTTGDPPSDDHLDGFTPADGDGGLANCRPDGGYRHAKEPPHN